MNVPTPSSMMRSLLPGLTALAVLISFAGCGDALSDSFSDHDGRTNAAGAGLLYVASGPCYAGGVTTSTGVATVVAYDMNGSFHHLVIDYNRISPGDAPVSIVEFDSANLLVLVENASGRRVDLVRKDGSALSTYLLNGAALTGVLRKLTKLPDSSLLVSKSTAIEKFSSAKARITQGANPFVSAPAGSCSGSATLLSSVIALNNGKLVFAHSAASPNNRLGLVSSTGYAAASDCLNAQAAPNTLAMPTSLVYHSSGKLLAAYASTTTSSNFIYAYDVNEAAGTLSAPISANSDPTLINGPSAMAENTATGDVFVANGNSAFNTIERFNFDPSTKLLTRVGTLPFIPSQIYTRCVSDLKVFSQ